jgi:hypothetical protein
MKLITHRPVIATVDLQNDKYLQHSVIQFLVNMLVHTL